SKRVTQIRRYTGAFQPLRVKAGRATPYVDPSGRLWAVDYGYLNGSPYTGAAGVDPIIQTERINSGTLEYQFAVPNASYTDNLTFGEIAGAQAHQRRFNIVVNGVTYFSDVDIILGTVVPNWPATFPMTVAVTNGQIDIQLVPITGS